MKWVKRALSLALLIWGTASAGQLSLAEMVETWRSGPVGANCVSVNPTDGSCWTAQAGFGGQVAHLSSSGAVIWESTPGAYYDALGVSVNPTDGSCWVAYNLGVAHLSATGIELWDSGSVYSGRSVSVNPTDGSCWMADPDQAKCVVHFSSDGAVLWQGEFPRPFAVSVNPSDGSCWVADWDGQVVHLSETGEVLWSSTGGDFGWPRSVSANPVDGSCWIADGARLTHVSADGTELAQTLTQNYFVPTAVSVDTADGSCWVAINNTLWSEKWSAGLVMHFDSAQTSGCLGVDCTGDYFPVKYSQALFVNPTDGSCWVVDYGTGQFVHVVEVPMPAPMASFAVVPAGGAAPLVASFIDTSTNRPTWWYWDFGDGWASSDQNPVHAYTDVGAYTVSLEVRNNGGQSSVTKPDYILASFKDVPVQPPFWALMQILACAQAGIVAGYGDGTYHPEYAVTRDQMAVYIARALANGDSNVPVFTDVPTFPDVPWGSWALDSIQYAADQGVVEGYDDGTYHPEYEVTRDQMAVYIARALVAPSGEAALDAYSPSDPRNFSDVPPGFWAYSHIEFCVENDVVQGYDDGLYHPDWVVTRDQMAVYVARAFGLPAS